MWRWMLMGLAGCAAEPLTVVTPADAELGQPRGAPEYFDLELDSVVVGAENTATFVAERWERVYLGATLNGEGPGPCVVILGGHCLHIQGPVTILADDYADEYGIGSITFDVPDNPALIGREACFQGVIIRGPGGTSSAFSEPICHTLE